MSAASAPAGPVVSSPEVAYHYTFAEFLPSIMNQGLRGGSFVSPRLLSPLQAQIDLGLPPNRGLPDTVLRIDLRVYGEQYGDIPLVMRVTGLVRGSGGRFYNVAGGGEEIQLPNPVPPEMIEPVAFPEVLLPPL